VIGWRGSNGAIGYTAAMAGLAIGCVLVAVTAAAAPDAMERRVRACTACHGTDAIEIDEGYVPRIQGKPAGYLYNQLVNFRAHRRRYAAMNRMVAHLDDRYLAAIAAYFAQRKAPYPEPAEPPSDAALRERGAELVRAGDPDRDIPACQSCHGERLAGVQPNTPGLIGLPRHYIVSQLGHWRTGQRRAVAPDCMARIAERLSERDIEAVAAWLAARPLPEDTRPRAQPIDDPPMACGSVAAPAR
jgi:cytochrome c553